MFLDDALYNAGLTLPSVTGSWVGQGGEVANLLLLFPCAKAFVEEQISFRAYSEEEVNLIISFKAHLEPVFKEGDEWRHPRAARNDDHRLARVPAQIQIARWRAEAHLIARLQGSVNERGRHSRRRVFTGRSRGELDHEVELRQAARTAGE